MLGSKLDIFKKEWLDVVFAGKNKAYGAYELRNENGTNTTKSLFIATSLFVLLFFTPKIINLIKGAMPEDEKLKAQEVVIAPPPPVNPKTPPPPPVEPPPSKQDQVKMPPPIVKPDEEVVDEPPTVEDVKKADPGQKTIKGDPDADIVITTSAGEGPKQAAVVEDNNVYDFVSIEQHAEFPGGMAKFYAFAGKTPYPPMASENNIQGKIIVSFIVEKDGKLTDIQVLRGLGYGLDEAVVKQLKSCPRWTPAIQNGKPVRERYSLPLNFQLQE